MEPREAIMHVHPESSSVSLPLENNLELKHCARYNNWFTRTISWLFGRSVDVVYDNEV